MGRDQVLNDWQKKFIYNLKMEAFEHGQRLSAREVIDKLIEYLVAEEMEKEQQLKGVKCSEAEIRKRIEDEQISKSAIIAFNGEVNKVIEQKRAEARWSIGLNYGVPQEMAGLLLEYWRELADPAAPGGDLSARLTVKRVKWMSKLFPFFNDVWESKYSEQPSKQKIGTLSRLADVYIRYEEVTKLISGRKDDVFDTTELDKLFFVEKDLSDDALWNKISYMA